MKSYRITIEINMSGDAGNESAHWDKAASIRCESLYSLEVDIAEWVKQEIDPTAIISITGCENCTDPANGIHAIDCRLYYEREGR